MNNTTQSRYIDQYKLITLMLLQKKSSLAVLRNDTTFTKFIYGIFFYN